MASIRRAIEWIAENDETAEERAEEMATLISVMLVADLFDKSPDDIARRVIRKRREIGILGPVRRSA